VIVVDNRQAEAGFLDLVRDFWPLDRSSVDETLTAVFKAIQNRRAFSRMSRSINDSGRHNGFKGAMRDQMADIVTEAMSGPHRTAVAQLLAVHLVVDVDIEADALDKYRREKQRARDQRSVAGKGNAGRTDEFRDDVVAALRQYRAEGLTLKQALVALEDLDGRDDGVSAKFVDGRKPRWRFTVGGESSEPKSWSAVQTMWADANPEKPRRKQKHR
jgi:hypothetical protein